MITILGPTACGKTALAVNLAAKTGGEIISADSRQVYRGMDIGTGKDLTEYNVDGKQIPYHLIDIEDAGQKYNLFRFQEDFNAAYKDITNRGGAAHIVRWNGSIHRGGAERLCLVARCTRRQLAQETIRTNVDRAERAVDMVEG